MQKINIDDTIVAISTPVGQGGIGVVRLSGKKALSIADKLFAHKGKDKPSGFKTHTVHFGWVVDRLKTKDQRLKTADSKQKTNHEQQATSDDIVDEVLLTVMRAPKTYTAEDVVEISCHGGVMPLRAILKLALDHGARLAEPGEFTKRAFLNGRMDLTQAEAVLDIISAKTDSFLKVSVNQLKGELTLELESIREALMSVYTHLEAIVNFPEDEVNAASKSQLEKQIKAAQERVQKLLESSEQGKILKEGIKVVLCGKPNVGKSSLLNVLLKQPRAIVTDIAGTTRDTIEETAQIKGIPFQLVDTAGILEPRDLIEKEAIKRSHIYIDSADLILFILDNNRIFSKEDKNLIEKIRNKNVLVVINKSDLPGKLDEDKVEKIFKGKEILKVSAAQKTAISTLENEIARNVWHGKTPETPRILISNLRHIASLKDCQGALEKARESFAGAVPFELISEEIKIAVNYLDNITGRNIDADLLDKIFSEFCIGK